MALPQAPTRPEADVAPAFPPIYAPVRILMLYLTENCNLRCTYCYVSKKPRHMSVETAKKAIDFFIDRRVSGVDRSIFLTFFGGEPFLRLDCMEEAVAYARQRRPNVFKTVQFSTTTNGTVSGPRVERIIRESRMALLLSMDGGPSSSAYRPFDSGRSSYELVARNLPRLASWASSLLVRMTFHPGSLDLLGNVRKVLALGAPSIVLCAVLEDDWTGVGDRLDAAYEALANEYIKEARAGRILPLETTNSLLRDHHATLRGGPRPTRPCGVGSSLMGVDADGNIMPCQFFLDRPQDRLGTVDRPEMDRERWRYVHLSSGDLVGCEGCVARQVCGGGCRASALEMGLSLYELNPGHCITMRAHVRVLHRIYDTLTAELNAPFAQMLVSPRTLNPGLAELAAR